MIADLKPYPEYKESGLPWLGPVPSNWKIVRNGSLFGQRNQTGYDELPILEVSLKTGVRVRDFQNGTRKQILADLGKYKRAAKHDLAYNMMRMWQGAVGVAPVDGLVSPAYVVARPYSHTDPRFFVALFRTGEYKSEIDSNSRGIVKDRNRLYWDDFKQICSPCPPPAEQAAIVRFLDWANGRLERTIRAKRKVITLLNEQKQAIIHRAVTRGLDPSVPLKPSGIPWLGDIPLQWEIAKLRRVCFYQEGPGLRTWQFAAGGIQVICVTNITSCGVDLGAYRRFISHHEYEQKYRHFTVGHGDLMLASSGNSWGKIAEYTGSATVILNTSTVRLSPINGSRLSSAFLRLVLGSDYVRLQLQALLTGSCQPNFGPSHLNRVVISFPSDHSAQDTIVSAVGSQIAPLEDALIRLNREIELLREYRTRLIADVVTGKLDVRQTAANLPDAPELAEEIEAEEEIAE